MEVQDPCWDPDWDSAQAIQVPVRIKWNIMAKKLKDTVIDDEVRWKGIIWDEEMMFHAKIFKDFECYKPF